jgi:hypothetical protein
MNEEVLEEQKKQELKMEQRERKALAKKGIRIISL